MVAQQYKLSLLLYLQNPLAIPVENKCDLRFALKTTCWIDTCFFHVTFAKRAAVVAALIVHALESNAEHCRNKNKINQKKKKKTDQPSPHYILMWVLHILSLMSTAAADICEVFV